MYLLHIEIFTAIAHFLEPILIYEVKNCNFLPSKYIISGLKYK